MTDDVYIIKKGSGEYSELLARISDPPIELYCRGNLALLNSFCLAVVGTRKASDYGRQATRDLSGDLARSGVTIVSGLALGVDALAHRSALDANGKTIAVLGTGIEKLHPKENERLGLEIIERGGLVISEYKGTAPGAAYTFPARNRIISGLSRGVLVVEADRKSGSLITASCALDQDRDVFAVPGSIYWPRSVGANWLISQGARLASSAADILEHYRLRQIPLPALTVSTEDPAQRAILTLLGDQGPTHMDAIAAALGGDASRALSAIALLELHGTISHQGNGTYALSTT